MPNSISFREAYRCRCTGGARAGKQLRLRLRPVFRKGGSDQGPRVKTDWGRRCTTEQVQDEQGQPKSHGWSPGKTIREDFAAAAGKSLRRLPAQISTTRQDLDLEPTPAPTLEKNPTPSVSLTATVVPLHVHRAL